MQGIPITRNWVVMMRSGTPAVDWGRRHVFRRPHRPVLSGGRKRREYRALNSDLDWLKQIGRVEEYDVNNVFFVILPNLNRLSVEDK